MRGSGWLFVALLIGFATLKLVTNPHVLGWSGDGDYYLNVARHVSEGHGLRTSVSLWYQGLEPLPHETTVYPLWPLLLGSVGRVADLVGAASWLPELLYLVGLALLYSLANRIGEAFGGASLRLARLPIDLKVGHLAMGMFGAAVPFFRHTSLPNAEALAFALLFAALLALDRTRNRTPVAWAALSGGLAGLAYLTRSQLIVVAPSVGIALLLAGTRDARYRSAAVAAFGASLLVGAPWVAFLATFVEHFDPRMLVDFAAYRETPELEPFQWLVPTAGIGSWLADRVRGLYIAFDPFDRHAYTRSFGPSVYLVPLAILAVALRAPAWRTMAKNALEVRWITVVATLLVGVGALIQTHAVHGAVFWEWLFHRRQGLPMILLITLSLAFLVRRRPAVRALALVITALSLAVQALQLSRSVGWDDGPPNLVELELSAWLDGQDPKPVSLTTRARQLGALGRSNFRWIDCLADPAHTRNMFRHLQIDYLILFERNRKCTFHRGVSGELELVADVRRGKRRARVYRMRRS